MIQKLSENTIFKYIVSGGISAVIDLAILYLFNSRLGIQYLLSATLAFLGAFCISFMLQKFWTFNKKELTGVRIEAASYLLVSLTGLALNILLMYVFVSLFHIMVMASQVIVGGLVAFMTYFLAKKVFMKTSI